MKLGSNMDRNISNLAEKFKEAEEHINTHYEVGMFFLLSGLVVAVWVVWA